MESITANELWALCKEQIIKGNGEKQIMISDDDEGNGFHHLLFGFTENAKDYDIEESDDVIILG